MAKFKVLVFKGKHDYVDESLLTNGVYTTGTPNLHYPGMTLQEFKENYKFVRKMIGSAYNDLIKNLEKCEMIEVELTFV